MSDDVVDACMSWLNEQLTAPRQLEVLIRSSYKKSVNYDYEALGYSYSIFSPALDAKVEIIFARSNSDKPNANNKESI
jgi:hypothetical protein